MVDPAKYHRFPKKSGNSGIVEVSLQRQMD